MEVATYKTQFLENVPREFLKAALLAVFDCYVVAFDRCESMLEDDEAENTLPFLRRTFLQQSLREAAKLVPGVVATSERAICERGQQSWWRHTLVRCGPVALTASSVGDPDVLVRPAHYRQVYAANNRQLLLFNDEEQAAHGPPAGSDDEIKLYGILLHGANPADKSMPAFAVIRFPNNTYDGYFPSGIDLFREFPAVVSTRTALASGVALERRTG